MLKILGLATVLAVGTLSANVSDALAQGKGKKCTISPRDLCFQKCKGPKCQTICASRPATC